MITSITPQAISGRELTNILPPNASKKASDSDFVLIACRRPPPWRLRRIAGLICGLLFMFRGNQSPGLAAAHL
jgi:hypothetical protein